MAEVEAAVWESRADGQVVGLTVRMGDHFHVHGGATVAEHVLPSIAQAYATGEVPALLSGLDR